MLFLGFFFFELIMMSCEFQNSTKDVTQRKIWNWTELCKGLNVCLTGLTNKTNGFYGTFSCKRFPTATATYGRLRRLCDNTPHNFDTRASSQVLPMNQTMWHNVLLSQLRFLLHTIQGTYLSLGNMLDFNGLLSRKTGSAEMNVTWLASLVWHVRRLWY